MKLKDSLPLKIALMGVLALLMLIPLAMVMGQIEDRQLAADSSRNDVSASWGRAQTLTGPVLKLSYETELLDEDQKKTVKLATGTVYPRTLDYDIDTQTQTLHRSIYDILVYGADVVVTGDFVIPAYLGEEDLKEQLVVMGLTDLRGIEGSVDITLGEKAYAFHSGSSRVDQHFPENSKGTLSETIDLDKAVMDGKTVLPFRLTYRVKGSSSLKVRPYGGTTEVKMRSDCPNPSFTGDFLPSEREVTDAGFSARWSVSEINRGDPDDTSFGVNMLQGVTQYQQTTRSAKYGILVILLVFIAGLAVELVGKKRIDLVQYSEFMRFPVAYGLAALMTVAALFGYFRGILRDKTAWLLTALVAVAYLLSYILLQMETYALLAGTLLLFVLLVGIMYLTTNLNKRATE